MKKILLFVLAICVVGGTYAQKKKSYAFKNQGNAIYKDIRALLDKEDVLSVNPFNPVTIKSTSKALTSIPIATSGNVYMCLVDGVKWLSYDSELNMITFAHRLGGPWGGTSGQLRVKYSNDFFATKDSVQYIQPGTGLCRYPSNLLYNPAGNTDPKNAFSLVCGPSTNGTIWVNNYFGSQTLGKANLDLQLLSVSADSSKFMTNGFSGGNGKYHALTPVADVNESSITKYYETIDGNFNSATNKFDWTSNYLTAPNVLFKIRTFSNAIATWTAHENIVYENDGLHGYISVIGRDSIDNPDGSSMPVIFKTSDGGASWVKSIYQHFAENAEIQKYIWPTLASWSNPDSTKWIYRPNISAGSTVDENNTPCVIDKNGNLHIAAIVEGLYSSHPDSLDYGYENQPKFLFDLIRYDTDWVAVFVDTLRTGVVDAAVSGFGTGADAQGWAHWIRISKSPDGGKVFVTWTDTDPTIDTTNIMPEIFSWGVDVTTRMSTAPTSFASGDGQMFYMACADVVAKENTTYKLPITYINIYESGPDPLAPQKHYYLNGIEFDESAFIFFHPEMHPPPVVGSTLSGVFNYNNTASVPLAGITLKLMDGLNEINTATTDAAGNYSFANVSNGSYTVDATTTKAWGGVTATDALKIKRHVVGVELFTEPIRLSAADANLSYTINSTDALKVQRRIAGLDLSFLRPDWNFEKPTVGGKTVTISGANVTQNFYGLCTADVNGSYNPPAVARQSLMSIDYTSTLFANLNETFELPVRITKPVEIGAMQLFINYPADLIKVEGLSMSTQDGDLVYNAENGQLRIVWTSLNPLSLNENDALVTLKLKAVNNFTNNVSIGLTNESELADAIGNEIGAGIHTSTIEMANASNIGLNAMQNAISVYPNPAKNNISIDLGKYSTKDVTVSICNSLGKQVATISKPEMNNVFKFNFAGFANGLYIIQINTPEGRIVKSVSINK